MAITISSITSPTLLNTGTLSKTINFSGRTTTSATGYVVADILVNNIVVGTATNTGATSNIAVTYTATALYNAATGSTPTGAVSYRIREWTNGGLNVGTDTSSGYNVSISAVSGMLYNGSFSTTANPWSVDNPTAFLASWSRTNTAFRARIKVYVGTTSNLIYNRSGYSTSMNYTPSQSEIDAINAVMTTSPKDLIYVVTAQFAYNTNVDLNGGGFTLTRTDGVTKNLYAASTISIFNSWAIQNNPSITLTKNSINTVYHKLTLKTSGATIKVIDWGITTTGTITLSTGEKNIILDAFAANGTSTTVTLDVETYEDVGLTTKIGSTVSSSVSVTASAATPTGFIDFNVQGASIPAVTISSSYSGFSYGVKFVNASGTQLFAEATTAIGATSYAATTLTNALRYIIYNGFANNATSANVTVQLRTLYGTKQIGTTQSLSKLASVTPSTFSLVAGTMSTDLSNDVVTAEITTASSLFKHSVRFNYPTIGDKTFTDQTITSIISNLDTTEQNNIFNAHTATKFITINSYMTTRYSKTDGSGLTINIGASELRTASVLVNFPDLSPIVTPVFSIESGSGTALYLANWTSLRATLNITYKNNATMSSSSLNFAGTTGSNVTYVIAPKFSTSGAKTFSYSLTDSRGYTVSGSTNTTILAYEAPKALATPLISRATNANAKDLLGTYIGFDFDAQASDVAGLNNTLGITFQYRALPSGTFGTSTLTPSGTIYTTSSTLSVDIDSFRITTPTSVYTITGGFLTTLAYEFKILVTDVLQTTTYLVQISTGQAPFVLGDIGVGIGKIPEAGRVLDVLGNSYVNGLPIATLETTAVSPANTDYLLISDASNSNQITRSILIGTGTTTYLRNDGTWVTPPDTNTTYSAGTGITLTGTSFSVVGGTGITADTGGVSLTSIVAGDAVVGALKYNSTTRLAGTLYGGTTAPSGSTRLNYDGYFYPTFLNLASSGDTSTAATHYFVETGSDGFVRPKTLANVKTEVVTKAAIEAVLTGVITTHSHVAAQLPNNVTTLWTGTISTTTTTGTLSSAVTNFDFVLVFGYTDNASSENGTSMLIYSADGLNTNIRAYNIGSNISTTSNSTIMFSFPTSTSIRLDLIAGSSTEALRAVYGINIV